MFTSHRKHLVYKNRKQDKYNSLSLTGTLVVHNFQNGSSHNDLVKPKENFIDDKIEEKKKNMLQQKTKDDFIKQGIKEHEENLKKNRSPSVEAELSLYSFDDSNSSNSHPIINRTFDERIDHYKYLHFVERQELFNIQYTTIHKAAMDGDYLGVKYFLSRKTKLLAHINVDDFDRVGLCPLHYATINGRLEIIELLIYCGCDVNIKTPDGLSPMMLACKHNQLESMKILFRYGGSITQISNNGMTCAHYAAINDLVEVLLLLSEFLLQLQAAVVTAIETRKADIDLTVLDSSNAQQLSSTMNEIEGFNILTSTVINQLEKNSIDPEFINKLTEIDILHKPTINGTTPLHLACESDSLKVVKLLVEVKRLPIDGTDSSHETALHKAGRNKFFILYKYLVSQGASENTKNKLKQTPRQLLYDDIQY